MIEQSTKKRMLIYSGSSNSKLAEKVAKKLGTEISEIQKEQFASGEIYIRLADSARGADCFVLQSHSGGINFTIMEQLLICLLYTSPSPRDGLLSRMPSSA